LTEHDCARCIIESLVEKKLSDQVFSCFKVLVFATPKEFGRVRDMIQELELSYKVIIKPPRFLVTVYCDDATTAEMVEEALIDGFEEPGSWACHRMGCKAFEKHYGPYWKWRKGQLWPELEEIIESCR